MAENFHVDQGQILVSGIDLATFCSVSCSKRPMVRPTYLAIFSLGQNYCKAVTHLPPLHSPPLCKDICDTSLKTIYSSNFTRYCKVDPLKDYIDSYGFVENFISRWKRMKD